VAPRLKKACNKVIHRHSDRHDTFIRSGNQIRAAVSLDVLGRIGVTTRQLGAPDEAELAPMRIATVHRDPGHCDVRQLAPVRLKLSRADEHDGTSPWGLGSCGPPRKTRLLVAGV